MGRTTGDRLVFEEAAGLVPLDLTARTASLSPPGSPHRSR
jgi:hypothetical protein